MIVRKIIAEENPDGKFKSEVRQFIEVASQKFDGLTADVRTNSFHLERLESMIEGLTSNVRTLSSQFNDVGIMAINDHKRIDNLEERVDVLESEAH